MRSWAQSVGVLLLANALAGQQQPCSVSLGSSGNQAYGFPGSSNDPSITPDGRFIAYESSASNLVLGDTNGYRDVFRFDSSTGAIVRLSVDGAGGEANQDSGAARVSANGDRVAFRSAANLDPGDVGSQYSIYLREISSSSTVWLSKNMAGAEPDGLSWGVAISADGRFVAFDSDATDLVPGDSNGRFDIFVVEVDTGVIERVSVASDGSQGNHHSREPGLSADGRLVVFRSRASNLAPGVDPNKTADDVFLHDRLTGTTEAVSINSAGLMSTKGGCFSPAVSSDGSAVAFWTVADDLVSEPFLSSQQVVVRDRLAGSTTLVSGLGGVTGNDISYFPAISPDGRFVSFTSDATNLIPGDLNDEADVFLHDRLTGSIRRVSEDSSGAGANGLVGESALSQQAAVIAFASSADNLVAGGATFTYDIHLANCGGPPTVAYCSSLVNSQGCVPSIAWQGTPSASAGAGFTVGAGEVLNNKVGVLMYSLAGWGTQPYLGGTLCLQAPLGRTPLSSSGGNAGAGADCSGSFSVDFNAWAASGNDPGLVAGEAVYAQFLSRDPAAPGTVSLTDAAAFVLAP